MLEEELEERVNDVLFCASCCNVQRCATRRDEERAGFCTYYYVLSQVVHRLVVH